MNMPRSRTRAGFAALALAVVVVMPMVGRRSPAQLRDPPDPPRPVPAALRPAATAEMLSGDLVSWNRASFTMKLKGGGERSVAWRDIAPQQAYDLRRRLIATGDATEWLDLGALMLAADAASLAERAFAIALKADERARPLVVTCRAAKQRGADPQEALNQALLEAKDDAQPRKNSAAPPPPGKPDPGSKDGDGEEPPEPGRGGRAVTPWPTPSPAEANEILRAWQSRIDESFRKHGVRMRTQESAHFVLYSILGGSDVKRILDLLELTYTTAGGMLGFDPKTNLFLGKTVVFVFPERSAWAEFERDHYGNPNTDGFGGFCHFDGPLASLCFYRSKDEPLFLLTLAHEAVHAIAHRVKSPANLPTWANEGLADFLAAQVFPRANKPSEQWQQARTFAQQKQNDLSKLIRRNYRDGSWPGDDGMGYPVSHMLTRYLVKRDEAAYRAWFADVKEGKSWREALEARYGAKVEALLAAFRSDIQQERVYTRIALGGR